MGLIMVYSPLKARGVVGFLLHDPLDQRGKIGLLDCLVIWRNMEILQLWRDTHLAVAYSVSLTRWWAILLVSAGAGK